MLGGYYLGQLYLGLSGTLNQDDILIIHNALHGHYVDNIDLLQICSLLIDEARHSTSSDNIDLVQIYQMMIDYCRHSSSSDIISLCQLQNLLIDAALHSTSSDKISKIFNWDDVNKYFGIYIKDYVDSGVFDSVPDIDKEIYILKQKQLGSFSQSGVDESGIYIKEDTSKGLL